MYQNANAADFKEITFSMMVWQSSKYLIHAVTDSNLDPEGEIFLKKTRKFLFLQNYLWITFKLHSFQPNRLFKGVIFIEAFFVKSLYFFPPSPRLPLSCVTKGFCGCSQA